MIPRMPPPPPHARIQKAMVNHMEHQLKSLTQILLTIPLDGSHKVQSSDSIIVYVNKTARYTNRESLEHDVSY